MIPKLIHQTAKTADLPGAAREYQQKLRALYPDWKYTLWTDADNLNFVSTEYPDFLDIYQRMPRNIMRADVIRYLLMDRLGGFYLDTDYEMLKRFDFGQHRCVLPLETVEDPGVPPGRISNAIFAAEPGHRFFNAVIDELTENPPLDPGVDVINSTGPGLITSVFNKVRDDLTDYYLVPKELLNPPTPRNERQYRKIVDDGAAYGIHHCFGSWREYTLAQRLRNRASDFVHRFM